MLKINPWLKIWVQPRGTLKAIKEYDPKYRFVLMCAIYGFLWMLSLCQAVSLGHYYGVTTIVILSLILSIPIGYIMISLSSLFFLWTGKLFRGQARYVEVRAAVAWANAPSVVTIITWFILIAAYGSRLFMVDQGAIGERFGLVDAMFIVQVIIAVWSFFILVFGIAGVQEFSAWRAFGSFVVVLCIWIAITLLLMFSLAYFTKPTALALLGSI